MFNYQEMSGQQLEQLAQRIAHEQQARKQKMQETAGLNQARMNYSPDGSGTTTSPSNSESDTIVSEVSNVSQKIIPNTMSTSDYHDQTAIINQLKTEAYYNASNTFFLTNHLSKLKSTSTPNLSEKRSAPISRRLRNPETDNDAIKQKLDGLIQSLRR